MTLNTYCDVSAPIVFDNGKVVDLLLKHDRNLLTDIIVHNETYERVCNIY